MLKKFTVRNYKNFKETLTLDFGDVGGYRFNQECIDNDVICKCLIYGRNATGKTNLGAALYDIKDIIFGVIYRVNGYDYNILNANSEETFALFDYLFSFGEDNLEYIYKRNDKGELLSEVLKVNDIDVYDLDLKEGRFRSLDLSLIGADTIQTDKYLESIRQTIDEIDSEDSARVPFLRFIIFNSPMKSDSLLFKLEDYVSRIRRSVVSNIVAQRRNTNVVEYLALDDNLSRFEKFLNEMGIKCKLEVIKSADGQSELFFKHKSLIPFYRNASSGTLALTNLYFRIISVDRNPSLFYLDEFDAYYNYEMSEKIVLYFKKYYPKSQIIMTTHNTNLMTNQLMRPDCLLILSRDGRITALCHATERELREGHNLEKLFIGGEFEKYE